MSDLILDNRLRALENSLSKLQDDRAIVAVFKWTRTSNENFIWGQLWRVIAKAIQSHQLAIDVIRENLKAAAGLGAPAKTIAVGACWADYFRLTNLREGSPEVFQAAGGGSPIVVENSPREIFQECLDLICGLAFRSNDFGANICQFADELIVSFARGFYFETSHPTVPASREVLTLTLSRVLRHRYSEWSVWSLPLIVHDFGHIVWQHKDFKWLRDASPDILSRLAACDPELTSFDEKILKDAVADADAEVKEEAKRRAAESRAPIETQAAERALNDLQEYFADAFGTLVMGPAYPCAAIHVRLNPEFPGDEPGGEHRTDHERAEVILSFLEKMNKLTDTLDKPYTGTLLRLRADWDAMVKQANIGRSRDPAAWAEKQKAVNLVIDWLWEKFQSRRSLWEAIYPNKSGSAVMEEGWNIATSWRDSLLKDEVPEVPDNRMLRDALNAGWACRIVPEALDPKRPEQLEKRVVGICDKIIKSRLGDSGSEKKTK